MVFYITTPIYYVNDRPHIGHIYSTVVADLLARFHRQRGRDVFLSTGTDEHAVKVAAAAAKNGCAPASFAETHAAAFRHSFLQFGVGFDDFIRTSEPRHIDEVSSACERLLRTGDIYRGNFEGWYDEGQEEYVTDTNAEAARFTAANGRPLVRRKEENYFFRLSRFRERIGEAIGNGSLRITPDARRAEVLSRLGESLRDVPISRKTQHPWGVLVPGTVDHRVYVWVDALLNYRTAARSAGNASAWPPGLHIIGKEILWFHAVLWPALLLALADAQGEASVLPRRIHAHSHWTHAGCKISKSLGNAIDATDLLSLARGPSGADSVRYFLLARGPIGAADADFCREEFVRFYNSDLANGFGNALSRVIGLLDRYSERCVPSADPSSPWCTELAQRTEEAEARACSSIDEVDLPGYVGAARALIRRVDRLIQETEPYKLPKTETGRRSAAAILRPCLETLLFSSDLLAPALPATAKRVRAALGTAEEDAAAPAWGKLKSGVRVLELGALFPKIR